MATQIINTSGINSARLLLTSDIVLTLAGGIDGQVFTLIAQQDSTGSHALTYTNVNGGQTITQTANDTTIQQFIYDANAGEWVLTNASADAVASYTVAGPTAVTQKSGLILVGSGATVVALTLALPVAGPPDQGGDDGKEISFAIVAAAADTVTTPSNGINGSKHILTFAAVGDFATLRAYNGVWYIKASNATLS